MARRSMVTESATQGLKARMSAISSTYMVPPDLKYAARLSGVSAATETGRDAEPMIPACW